MNTKKNKELAKAQAAIRRPGPQRFAAIHAFRSAYSTEKYFSAYSEIFPFRTSLQDFHGSPFPRTANQIFSNNSPRERLTAFRELIWAIARCLKFTAEISKFLTLRENLEWNVLSGEYEGAVRALASIENEFGKSIWLYQNRISAAYVSKTETTPAEVANEIQLEVDDNVVLSFMMYYIRRRIEGAFLRQKLNEEMLSPIDNELYKSYFQTKIFQITDSSNEAVSSLLFIDARASLLDHYESLVLSLQSIISDDLLSVEMSSAIAGPIRQLHSKTNDKRLTGILVALHRGKVAEFDGTEQRRAKAIELYTQGKYKESAELSQIELEVTPNDSALRIVYIKAKVALNEIVVDSGDLPGSINANLYNLLAANENFFRSIHALLVLADRFYDHSWMLYLRVAIFYEMGPEEAAKRQSWMRDMYVRDSHVTPFSAFLISDVDAYKFASNSVLCQAYPDTTALVREVFTPTEPLLVPSTPRAARYRARSLLADMRYPEAVDLYLAAAASESCVAVKLRALGGASLAMMRNGDRRKAVDTLVDGYLANRQAPTLLPYKGLVDAMQDASDWPETISFGILLHIYSAFTSEGDLSKQRLAFENFCLVNEIKSPAALYERSQEFGEDRVIEYLDSVWRPEVMRQTLLYSSPEEIEEARIEACKILARVNRGKSTLHEEELAFRIKQQEISKTTRLVEQSKVYVDIEAIKRSLRTRLETSYAQYKGSLAQQEKPADEMVQIFKGVLSDLNSTESLSAILSKLHILGNRETPTQAELQFDALFSDIAKEFLTGDHGLNAYLSTRGRHGKLVDALRKFVMDEHLVTNEISHKKYGKNIYWNDYL